MEKARGQHYLFAHRALPSIFHAEPEKFILALAKSRGDVLNSLWGRVGQDVQGPDLVTAEGLGYEIRNPGNETTIALITLPSPRCVTEAYFVALAYRPQKKGVFSSRKAVTRYITLEYGFETSGIPRTVLCEWKGDGTHLNMGNGPAPTLQAFFEAVCNLLGI
jgi:hypothetical protein